MLQVLTYKNQCINLCTWYLESKEKKRRISAESSSSIHSNTAVQQQPVNPGNTKTENQQYQNETQTDARKQSSDLLNPQEKQPETLKSSALTL